MRRIRKLYETSLVITALFAYTLWFGMQRFRMWLQDVDQNLLNSEAAEYV